MLEESSHLLPRGALAVTGNHLGIRGRRVCLYDYGKAVVRYFSPSLSQARTPVRSGTDDWKGAIHDDDREWLVELHDQTVARGLGYEALFRYVDPDDRQTYWIVDRQEPTDLGDDVKFHGMSLDVTDLIEADPRGIARLAPLPLEICCVSRPELRRSPHDRNLHVQSHRYAGLPLSPIENQAWLQALADGDEAPLLVPSVRKDGSARTTMIVWTPLRGDATSELLAVAVGDATEHVNANAVYRRRLAELARARRGAGFSIAPGGRVRVRHAWLEALDPSLRSYSDLLGRAPGSEVRAARDSRHRAMDGLEGYFAVLTCRLGDRVVRLAEAGLPDASGGQWDCVLVPLSERADDTSSEELQDLIARATFDPRARLYRALLHRETAHRLTRLLVHVGEHEAHVRRRLAMVEDWGDPGVVARLYSHSLAGPMPDPQ